MFECVVSLSQMLYVKCLCVLSRYLSPVVEILFIHLSFLKLVVQYHDYTEKTINI